MTTDQHSVTIQNLAKRIVPVIRRHNDEDDTLLSHPQLLLVVWYLSNDGLRLR